MGKATTPTTLHLNKRDKEIATKVFAKLGLDLSAGVNLYLSQVAVEQRIPFELSTDNPLDRASMRAHAEIERGEYDECDSVEDLLKDLNDED